MAQPDYSSRELQRVSSVEAPRLPTVIRYYDDFSDVDRSIHDPEKHDVWTVYVSGSIRDLDFGQIDATFRTLIKRWCDNALVSYSPDTTVMRFASLCTIRRDDMSLLVSSTPLTCRDAWRELMARKYGAVAMTSLKSILYFYCQCNLLGWSAKYIEILSTLPLPFTDKYASVRSGDTFLSVEEEAKLVAHFDELAKIVDQTPEVLPDEQLLASAVLVCSFQFGLRPKQIGMLRMSDVRIWKDSHHSIPAVHLTFKMTKQRLNSKSLPLTRKIKREWAPIFVDLYKRSKRRDMSATDHFFRVSSASEVSSLILRATHQLLNKKRSATALRHTAAQRLVDAGANQEELAEFLGHSDITTGLVYFQTSANQAELVNSALGVSSIYQQVTKIAHDRFIDKEELAHLKGDQQIGAVPHGVPIVGIGACAIGQPACPSNPVTACYGCYKFMPINEPSIHRTVLEELRTVVKFFADASQGDQTSPAYVQLKNTISNVQSIVSELEGLMDE